MSDKWVDHEVTTKPFEEPTLINLACGTKIDIKEFLAPKADQVFRALFSDPAGTDEPTS